MVSIITDSYRDFGTIGQAALKMVAARRGVELSEDRLRSVLSRIRELPPHREVPGALRRLDGAGCAAALVARPGMVLDPLARSRTSSRLTSRKWPTLC